MGGYRHLPDEGGVNAQATWLMAAFDVIAAALEVLKPKRD
jgi:hypothetical protein